MNKSSFDSPHKVGHTNLLSCSDRLGGIGFVQTYMGCPSFTYIHFINVATKLYFVIIYFGFLNISSAFSQKIVSEPQKVRFNNLNHKPDYSVPFILWQIPLMPDTIVEISSIKIKILIKSIEKVKSVDIYVNNELLPYHHVKPLNKMDYRVSTLVELQKGLNEITVCTKTSNQTICSKPSKIVFQKGSIKGRRYAMYLESICIDDTLHHSEKINHPIKKTLENIGFKVTSYQINSFLGLEKALNEFYLKAQFFDVVLLYFGGSLIEKNNQISISPIFEESYRNLLESNSIPVSSIINKMNTGDKQIKIMALENFSNCYEKAISDSLKVRKYFEINAPRNFIVITNNSIDRNDSTNNYLFSNTFKKLIPLQGVSVEQIAKKFTGRMKKQSSGKQKTSFSIYLTDDFYFVK
jgi:hypothetical protein